MRGDSLPVTVVVPSLNQGRFIGQTIESILRQDYSPTEVIVVDGASTDETLDVLRGFGREIKWLSEADTGQSNAINKGLAMAAGKILCWLNSDDLLEPHALGHVVRFFEAHPSAQSLFGRCRIIDENGKAARSLVEQYKTWWARVANTRRSLLLLNYVPQPAAFWRRSAMARTGMLDESLYYTMDYDLWLKLTELGPMHFLDRYLASFRVHSDSKSVRGTRAQLAEGLDVAKRHGAAGMTRLLHDAHDSATLRVYRMRYHGASARAGEPHA